MKWLSFYATPDQLSQKRNVPLAGNNKLDYIFRALNEVGVPVDVIAAGGTTTEKTLPKQEYTFDGCNHIWYPFSLGRKNYIFRKAGTLFLKMQIFLRILKTTRKGEVLACYHSLWYMNMLRCAKRIKGFKLILEMEEVYGDVSGNDRAKAKEFRLAACADAFIFPTELLNEAVNKTNKPYALIHGTYQVEPDRNCRFNDGKIHAVYAGTLDPRKGGGLAAAKAAEFLGKDYHIHILGFGSEEQKKELRDVISNIADRTECAVTYDGCLSGEAYIRFIQSCDIGLSTQNPDAAFNGTSFPSKILSYMANGLRVVSIRIPAVETSAIGKYMYYYDQQTPEEIAKAIMAVNLHDDYDGRQLIAALDQGFKKDLSELLKEVTND